MNPYCRNLFEYLGAPTSLTPKDLNTHIRMQAHLTEEERNTCSRAFMNADNKLTNELETCRYKRPLPKTEPAEYRDFCQAVSGSSAEPMPYRFFSAEYKTMFDKFGMDGDAVSRSLRAISDGWRIQAWAAWYLHLAQNAETDDPQNAPSLWETAFKLYKRFFSTCKVDESYTFSFQTDSDKQEQCRQAWDAFLQNQLKNIKSRRASFLENQNIKAADACLQTLKLLDAGSYSAVMENALLPVIRAIQNASSLSEAASVYYECSEDIRQTDKNNELKSAMFHAMKAELERGQAVFAAVPDVLQCMESLKAVRLYQESEGVLKIDVNLFYDAVAAYARTAINEEQSTAEMAACACEMTAIGKVPESLAFDSSGTKQDTVAPLLLAIYAKRRASQMKELSAEQGKAFGQEILSLAKKMGYGKPHGEEILKNAIPAAAIILRDIANEKEAVLIFIDVFDKDMQISDTGLPTVRQLYDFYDKTYEFSIVDNSARQNLNEEWKCLGASYDGTTEQEDAVIRLITSVYENRSDKELAVFARAVLSAVYAGNAKNYENDGLSAVSRRIMAQIAAFKNGEITYRNSTAAQHENRVDAERSLAELAQQVEKTDLREPASEQFVLAVRKLLYYYRKCRDFSLGNVSFKEGVRNYLLNTIVQTFEKCNITVQTIQQLAMVDAAGVKKMFSDKKDACLNILINAACMVFTSGSPQYNFLLKVKTEYYLPSWSPDPDYQAKIVSPRQHRKRALQNTGAEKNFFRDKIKQLKPFFEQHKKAVIGIGLGTAAVIILAVVLGSILMKTNSVFKTEMRLLREAEVGSIVTFGAYEQDNDTSNGREPINWKVLSQENGKVLLISEYALDCIPYNDFDKDITWETCELKWWLNKTFRSDAFNDKEREMIASTFVSYDGADKQESKSEDGVFVLSSWNAEEFFESDEARRCAPTPYAIAHGANTADGYETEQGESSCSWWLCSNPDECLYVAGVNADGSIDDYVYYVNLGVRPAIWVDLSDAKKTDEKKDAAAEEIELHLTVGDTVSFGAYEQDNDTTNGKEAIEWVVLEGKGDEALLLSKYALDCQPFNDSKKEVTWENCTLRTWLNGKFFQDAFSEKEQERIQTVTVTADANPDYTASAGNDTNDKVFLLSFLEAAHPYIDRYFFSNMTRRCAPTAYALAQGAYTQDGNYLTVDGETKTCGWWLRSTVAYYSKADYVMRSGHIDSTGGCDNNIDDMGVRPALWIKTNSNVAVPAQKARPDVTVGDVISFGSYEQDNNASNGREKIEWLVLDRTGDRALLTSVYALDCKPYNTADVDVTWETCSLRIWLNSIFLKTAFSAEEQACIQATVVRAHADMMGELTAGNDTQDKVFLLSITEHEGYCFWNDADNCTATAYAVAQGVRMFRDTFINEMGEETCYWWLRSPGSDYQRAATARDSGMLTSGDAVICNDVAVRPAIWIDLSGTS